MRPNPDRPEFAIVSETQLALRCMFIEIYIEAEDFCADLIALAEGFDVEQRAPDSARAVAQFCERWGLTFADKAADQAVHWWCMERRIAGGQFAPGNLVTGFHAGSNLPPDDIAPPAADRWDPTRESRDSAGERILATWKKHLDAELDRIFEDHKGASTPMVRRPYKRKEVAKHLRWLFLRQAFRLSFAKIAQGPPVWNQANVRMACGRLAGELDLILWHRMDKSRQILDGTS